MHPALFAKVNMRCGHLLMKKANKRDYICDWTDTCVVYGFLWPAIVGWCGCGDVPHATSLSLHVIEFQAGLGRQWHHVHVLT